MQSNIDCLVDDINEFADSWVEIYNPTNEAKYFEGYKLGTSPDPEQAYNLAPQYVINPNSHFVIFCDKNNFNRHTNFRLESGKGSVYLFKGDEIIDKVENFKAQPAPNISYGRETDMSDVWGYQLTPTPRASNTGGISSVILGNPVFSSPGRVGNYPVTLKLTIPAGMPEGTEIRYTLDGSEPSGESHLYSAPIAIESTTVVRAKLVCEGTISPRSVTHSYIFHDQEMTLPIISLVTNDEFLYSDELGILSSAKTVGDVENFRWDWRRPVNFEFFTDENTKAKLNQLCETKIKGNATRHYLIKSMVLYANKRFGVKRFSYEFFPDQKPGLTEFKSIELRNAGNDCYKTYMRDALVQRMMGENADIDWQAWQPAVVYINGEYLGLLNIRERSDEDNIYTNYDGLEDIDLIENFKILKEGSLDNFNAFRAFYSSDEKHSLEEYAKWMDVDEFINYFILNMYYGNVDFPGNNCIMWRPLEKDGKWRWLCKDMDLTMGINGTSFDVNYFDWFYNPEKYPTFNWALTDESTLLFKRLLEMPDFQEKFLQRFAVLTGEYLTSKKTIDKMNQMWEVIKPEWDRHYEKNSIKQGTHAQYRTALALFIEERERVIYDHMAEWFGEKETIKLVVEKDNNLFSDLVMSGVKIASEKFEGKFFADRDMEIECLGASEDFYGWKIVIRNKKGKDTTNYVF